jgi:hypothetical protein
LERNTDLYDKQPWVTNSANELTEWFPNISEPNRHQSRTFSHPLTRLLLNRHLLLDPNICNIQSAHIAGRLLSWQLSYERNWSYEVVYGPYSFLPHQGIFGWKCFGYFDIFGGLYAGPSATCQSGCIAYSRVGTISFCKSNSGCAADSRFFSHSFHNLFFWCFK